MASIREWFGLNWTKIEFYGQSEGERVSNCARGNIIEPQKHLLGGSLLLTGHHEQQPALLVILAVIFDPGHAQSPWWEREKNKTETDERGSHQELKRVQTKEYSHFS